MKRAKDDITGSMLFHDHDGGPLYIPSGESSTRPRYYFCLSCDANGRQQYVQASKASFGSARAAELRKAEKQGRLEETRQQLDAQIGDVERDLL